MEAAPPSYETATIVYHWDIIARYVPSNDLCSAALVCSRWHSTFTPHLWGNPASHFGVENDRVYVALTKFKRTLQTARLLVRSLTHTLHLPPAHAEIYNGPHADWLRDILEKLPNLQSLIVRGLPFFDHSALQALQSRRRKSSTVDDAPQSGTFELPASLGTTFQRQPNLFPSFGLRLLDASRCSNVTSSSLAQALCRFESLLYLDLSFTYAARDPIVLKSLRRFLGLQVLKLRGVSLSDETLSVLAIAIGRRVRSLDIRDNNITDRGIRTLLDECFITSGESGSSVADPQRSPGLLPYIGREMLDIYQGEDFEGFMRHAFTGRFIGRLAIEDVPEGGITHLYITGNHVTVDGISSLVSSSRLHVLDAQSDVTGFGKPLFSPSLNNGTVDICAPGVEKLTPVVAQYAVDGLKFLRIDHSLVTKDGPLMHDEEVIQGRCEVPDTMLPDLPRDAVEIEATAATPEAFELPTVQTPKYELPGDPMQFVVSFPINDQQHQLDDEQLPFNGPRRGSAFAPEVVDTSSNEPDLVSPMSAMEAGRTLEGFRGLTPVDTLSTDPGFLTLRSPVSPFEDRKMMPTFVNTNHATSSQNGLGRPIPRFRTYSSVADERRVRLAAHKAVKRNLHPAMLPHLNTLVLTDVPPFSPTRDVSDRLIHFVRQCAEEASLAISQAKLDYGLPPGRTGHTSALKHSAEKIFALKRIVLEIAPEQTGRRSRRTSQWQHHTTRSMTEDRDSDTLWSAGENDFTFFGDEDYGFPSLDSGRYAHSSMAAGKEVSFGNEQPWQSNTSQSKAPAPLKFDNVALLSAFRKERNIVHLRSVAAGTLQLETEGYWEGAIQIRRPGVDNTDKSEEIDYYGNSFTNGVYR